MPKRDPEDELVDEELADTGVPTVGERLRAAREEKKLSLEDIAAQTRIPQRHLESIETARLGQASRADLHHRVREELRLGRRARPHRDRRPAARGDGRPALRLVPVRGDRSRRPGADHAQMAGARGDRRGDRADRVMSVLNRRSLEPPEEAAPNAPVAAAPAPTAPHQQQPRGRAGRSGAGGAGRDGGRLGPGDRPGQDPVRSDDAAWPDLSGAANGDRADAPRRRSESLRINVGSAVAPQVGPSGQVTSNVSLKAPDLMRGPAQAPAPAARRSGFIRGQGAARHNRSRTRVGKHFSEILASDHRFGGCALVALAPASTALAQRQQATPEQRIDRLERQVNEMQRRVFPKGRPADTAGFSDDPAATQSSVISLDQRIDALERQLADMLRQGEENGNRLRSIENGMSQLRATRISASRRSSSASTRPRRGCPGPAEAAPPPSRRHARRSRRPSPPSQPPKTTQANPPAPDSDAAVEPPNPATPARTPTARASTCGRRASMTRRSRRSARSSPPIPSTRA